MALGTLTIDLAANLAGLESDLGKAQRLFDKNARNFERTVKGTAKVAAGIAAGAAVGLSAMVKSSIDSADALSKQSQVVGVAIEDLSKLKYAAELSDVGFEALTTGLKKFDKNITEAAKGTGAQADAFKILGINLKNNDGSLKSTNQLVGDVADAFARFEDGANKTAIATELFGKSGADLIPMLNGGRQTIKQAGDELERMGGVIDKNTGLAAERFNDNINRLRESLSSMGAGRNKR